MAQDLIAGRYRLLEPLGGGAMGAVWLAEDAELGRQVAVKLLGPDADRARFDREARAAASLAHPNIVQLYDYGEDEGRPYMILEYLSGGSLDDRITRGRALPDDETERIAREIAAGLAHAHARGLVHRDLKPANILFDAEGRARIGDFGIARMGGAGTLTEAGTVLGTAAYISPEQARGEVATPASDVYSFGVMLFLMLTGRLPFEAPGAMELAAMHRDREPPPVSAFRPTVPAELARIAEAALRKDPAARPPDGAALAGELGGAGAATLPTLPLTGEPTVVMPRARPAQPQRSRRIVVFALIGAAALLGAGVALAFLTTGGDSGGSAPSVPLSNITPPTTARATTAPQTTAATTTAPATTAAPATAPTTSPPATTAPTTAPTTTPTTTAQTTTAQTTTAQTTTAETTAPTTTDTGATTATDTTPAP